MPRRTPHPLRHILFSHKVAKKHIQNGVLHINENLSKSIKKISILWQNQNEQGAKRKRSIYREVT